VEDHPDLRRRQQVEDHQHVGLLGHLVAVRRVALRLQDPVEPLDVAVALLVVEPVELLEAVVAVELADDTVVVEADAHPAADVVPAVQLVGGQAELIPQLPRLVVREQVEDVERPADDPDGHHVRVRVVVQAGHVGPGVAVVVLVGTHHPRDLVPVERVVVRREAGQEPGDLDDHRRRPEAQELDVAGDLVVAPRVVGDGDVDVALEAGVVGQPPPGPGVEMERLRLLPAIAAALPREHRARAALPPGRPPGRCQPPEPVVEHRPGQDRKPQVEQREDEQLVPEDVPAVGLAVQASGRDATVEADRVG
jgi:hypothetical protein